MASEIVPAIIAPESLVVYWPLKKLTITRPIIYPDFGIPEHNQSAHDQFTAWIWSISPKTVMTRPEHRHTLHPVGVLDSNTGS